MKVKKAFAKKNTSGNKLYAQQPRNYLLNMNEKKRNLLKQQIERKIERTAR